jgi:hypothetical protein
MAAQGMKTKINGPKYAFSGIFAYGDPRMQISRVQNVCKSPYANPHMRMNTAQTLQKELFAHMGSLYA